MLLRQQILDDSFHQPFFSLPRDQHQLARRQIKRLPVPIPGWKYPFPFRTRQSSSLGR